MFYKLESDNFNMDKPGHCDLQYIEKNDLKLLTTSQGIGKRIAERLVIELKNKIHPQNQKTTFVVAGSRRRQVRRHGRGSSEHVWR